MTAESWTLAELNTAIQKATAWDKLMQDIKAGGWKIVPVEATDEMFNYRAFPESSIGDHWDSMIELAPAYELLKDYL